MKNTLILVLLAVFLTSCGRYGPGSLRRDQEQYEVVEEGSASGDSSTLAAPGEAPPALPTLTGTNADTTTDFTLYTGTTTDIAPPGSIAGTLSTGEWSPPPPPRPRTPTPPPPPPPTTTATEPAPPPVTEPEPAPEPEEREEEEQDEEKKEEKPPDTSTQAPPPPSL